MLKIAPYLLAGLSIFLETGKNIFSNNFSKNALKNNTDIYKFNFFMYIASVITLSFFGDCHGSLFSVILAFFFALAIWLNQYFFLKALKLGSMSFTTFIQCISLVIPIIFAAIFWGDKITIFQIIMLAILLGGLALALNIGKTTLNIKWLLYSILVMLFLGVIGIIQAYHQSSTHKGEIIFFLRMAFVFTVTINLVGWIICERKSKSNFSIKSSTLIQAGVSGAFMGAVHVLSLYLAGQLPYVVFFPLSNGGLIFITLLSDLIIFKERLNLKQWIGIAIGTLALCIIDL